VGDEGLRPYAWSNGPGDVYAPHRHAYHKVIYVARGSITFQLPERGQSLTLAAGDRLDLPADVVHAAVAAGQLRRSRSRWLIDAAVSTTNKP
jgi:uncharacterized protein YjlB